MYINKAMYYSVLLDEKIFLMCGYLQSIHDKGKITLAIMFREELVGVIINKTLNDGQCGYSGTQKSLYKQDKPKQAKVMWARGGGCNKGKRRHKIRR